ncbi:MAG: radical SAM protein [Candidatus Aminicenantes bacterium]|nr:radical SAM protein [Candidatus Aminicenantes bacterium]
MKTSDKIKKIGQAQKALAEHKFNCRLCPRDCSVNRNTTTGYCSSENTAFVSHIGLHFGEEPVLSGHTDTEQNSNQNPSSCYGSGTIFFTGCHLKCLHCQNHQISWGYQGQNISVKGLAHSMLGLQKKGALNINLVSPTHMLLPILSALKTALQMGLKIPLVFNSSGYEKRKIIRQLNGIIDLYLPDLKYFSSQISKKLSGVSDYFDTAQKAVYEMSIQQPDLILDESGIAQKGLIVRHLLIPGEVDDSLRLLDWVKENLPNTIGISLMSQFYPCFKTPPEYRKKITADEYEKAVRAAKQSGFRHLFVQPELFSDLKHLIPDFSQKNPFQWD